MTAVRVCRADDLVEDQPRRVVVGATPLCLVRSGGRVHALLDRCSHADVALSEGEVADGEVECWLHGSTFDLETGEPQALPANRPVPVYPTAVEGGDVVVDLPADH